MILEWSRDKPIWQRDALRRIVLNGFLNDADIRELVELCKSEIEGNTNPNIAFSDIHIPSNPDKKSSVSLLSISDINDANCLAPHQKLTFEKNGITIIYGDNGTGKSGYARILKRVCRARHSNAILPNAYTNQSSIKKASGTITFNIGEVEQSPLAWEDSDNPHPILSAISVFDSHCAEIHLTEKNDVAFRPFGLDIPDELANVCQKVKEVLQTQEKNLENRQNSIFKNPTWKPYTQVGKLLSSLKFNSDIQSFSKLSILTNEESVRFEWLREDLAKDSIKASNEAKSKADDIHELYSAINQMEKIISDDYFLELFSLNKKIKEQTEISRLAANRQFSEGILSGIGSDAWILLWNAAKRYSTEIAYPDKPYPPIQNDILCVLCQQKLNEEAVKRLEKFEEFIENDIARHLNELKESFQEKIRPLNSTHLNTVKHKSLLQKLKLHNPEDYSKTVRFIASARLRRYFFINSLKDTELLLLPTIAPKVTENLQKIECDYRNYSSELLSSLSNENRKILENEFYELSDRRNVGNLLSIIQEEVMRLKNLDIIKKCILQTSTTAITKLGNSLADEIITPKLRDKFQEEIIKLTADKVRVELVRSGGKCGSPYYQIKLFVKPDAKIDTILSEGEQKCVAFAAFLTELTTAEHNSTIVFDDPVTSLDHRWRKKIAERIVEEARARQIIVFTHDIVFVNDLHDLAKRSSIPNKAITITRETAGTGIIQEGFPWIIKSVADRLDSLDKELTLAKNLFESHDEEKYHEKASSIYNKLRATWERALEDIAFSRVIQRHRDYIDTKHLKNVSVLDENDCDIFNNNFKKCCDHIDGHDPSVGRNASVPLPSEIKNDIQSLRDWINSLRDRQKDIK